MKIMFNITDTMYPICIKNNKYENTQVVASYILKNKEKIENIKIVDGIITFNFKNTFVKIVTNNRLSNNEILNEVIKFAKAKRKEIYRKKLRNRKIKRVLFNAAIGLGISFTISALATSILIVKDTSKLKKKVEENKITYNDPNIKSYEYNNMNLVLDNNEEISINLDYNDRTDTDKFKHTKEVYFNKINEYSKKYNINPYVMLAIATQETGGEENYFYGSGKGLMQIEESAWDNEILKAYNTELNDYETIRVDGSRLNELDYNIKVACMYFQNCLTLSNYKLDVAIQMYNYGYGNMTKVLRSANDNLNLSFSECMNHYVDNWKNFRSVVNSGDKLYLEHILSYIEDSKIDINKVNSSDVITYNINKNNRNLTI